MVNFIQKLYAILNDDTYNHYISWSRNGVTFTVVNSKVFAAEVLPRIFKHSNFISFVRQLNLYNFHKVNRAYHRQNSISDEQRAAEPREFTHDFFIKDRPELLTKIHRKAGSIKKKNKNQIPKTDSTKKAVQEIDNHYTTAKSFTSTNINNNNQHFSDDNLPNKTDLFFHNMFKSRSKVTENNGLLSPTSADSSRVSFEFAVYSRSPSPPCCSKNIPATPESLFSVEQQFSEDNDNNTQTFFDDLKVSNNQTKQDGYVSVFPSARKNPLSVYNLLSSSRPSGNPSYRYIC
ncbi:hypothetical protein HDU92_004449 [Lobulomyces angularis]|nr:hypothetical protein HDU92_004449 [Lobulomyces angularis]